MNISLKNRILQNSFVTSLMEHRIDRMAFTELRDSLQNLAKEWSGKEEVDKQLALELYVTASVMRNEILFLREIGHDSDVDELANMFLEIDRLITEECLALKAG